MTAATREELEAYGTAAGMTKRQAEEFATQIETVNRLLEQLAPQKGIAKERFAECLAAMTAVTAIVRKMIDCAEHREAATLELLTILKMLYVLGRIDERHAQGVALAEGGRPA